MSAWFSKWMLLQGYLPNLAAILLIMAKTGAIFALGAGLSAFMRRRSARARCWIWRGCLVAVSVLFVLTFLPEKASPVRLSVPVANSMAEVEGLHRTLSSAGVLTSPAAVQRIAEQRTMEARERVGVVPPWEQSPVGKITYRDWLHFPWKQIEMHLKTVWLVVAGLLIAWWAIRAAGFYAWLRRNGVPASERIEGIARQTASELGLRHPAAVRLCRGLESPLLIGLARPSVCLPEAAASWDSERLYSVLLHETSHWKRKDLWWQYAARLLRSLFWWNPLPRLMARHMALEAEEAADDEVVVRIGKADVYAETLVQIAAGYAPSSQAEFGVSMVGWRLLEKRVRALLAANPWRGKLGSPALTAIAAVIVLGLLIGSLSVVAVQASGRVESVKEEPKLTTEQKSSLERIVERTKARLAQMRYLHFTMEVSTLIENKEETIRSPMPSKLEAWVDEWTGIYRAEYHPRVSRWISGAAPFWIKDQVEVNDGRSIVSIEAGEDPVRRDASGQGRLDATLGLDFSDSVSLLRILEMMLKSPSLATDQVSFGVDEVDWNGQRAVEIREQYLDGKQQVFQKRRFLVLPAHDDLLCFSETSHPLLAGNEPRQWILVEAGITDAGNSYPKRYKSTMFFDGERTTIEYAIKNLEVLQQLPPAVIAAPSSGVNDYVAPAPVAHESITLRYIEAETSKPLAEVEVEVRVNGNEMELRSDAAGKVRIPLPAGEVKDLSASAFLPGTTPQRVAWHRRGDPLQLPEQYDVILQKGTPISGKVVDEEGRPVRDAEVEIWHSGGPRTVGVFSNRFDLCGVTAKTNGEGVWQFPYFPGDLTNLMIRISRPGFAASTDSGMEDFRMASGLEYSALRDGTFVYVLKRGLELRGRVTDQQGAPLGKCRLTIDRDIHGTNCPSTITDSTGNYRLGGLKEEHAWLTVEAAGHKPQIVQVSIPADQPVDFALAKGNLLTGRLIKPDGTPCAGADVIADDWKELRTLTFATKTDGQGRFAWTGAPDEPVEFTFLSKEGEALYGLFLKAGTGEQTVVMKPALRVSGKVLDARTGTAIRSGKVTPGRIVGPDNIYWERDYARLLVNGEFDWKTSFMGQDHLFLIEAEGYEPFQTREFAARQNEEKEIFRLVSKR